MPITENEYTFEFVKKYEEPCVIIMPCNMNDLANNGPIYSTSSIDILKLFKSSEIKSYLYEEDDISLQENRANDWLGPLLFISYMTLMQNPEMLSIILNIISSYVYDFFKGAFTPGKAKFSIIRENKDGSKTEINYEGNIDGIKELEQIVKATK